MFSLSRSAFRNPTGRSMPRAWHRIRDWSRGPPVAPLGADPVGASFFARPLRRLPRTGSVTERCGIGSLAHLEEPDPRRLSVEGPGHGPGCDPRLRLALAVANGTGPPKARHMGSAFRPTRERCRGPRAAQGPPSLMASLIRRHLGHHATGASSSDGCTRDAQREQRQITGDRLLLSDTSSPSFFVSKLPAGPDSEADRAGETRRDRPSQMPGRRRAPGPPLVSRFRRAGPAAAARGR